MNKPVYPSDKHRQPSEPLDERVAMLFEELALAVKWQRPSILLAIYASELVCIEAQIKLERKVAELDQAVSHLSITGETPDIPLLLSRSAEREKTIFFVKGLKPGRKNQAGQLVYRALNIRRELLVDYRVRVVFWITEQEAADLPVHAPDFWAFRHRAIEFLDRPRPDHMLALAEVAALEGQRDRIIEAFKKALKSDPKNSDLLLHLAHIYRKAGRFTEARKAYRSVLRLQPDNGNARAALAALPRN